MLGGEAAMKCETYQIRDHGFARAVDETEIPREIRAHVEVCAVCREFYAAQRICSAPSTLE